MTTHIPVRVSVFYRRHLEAKPLTQRGAAVFAALILAGIVYVLLVGHRVPAPTVAAKPPAQTPVAVAPANPSSTDPVTEQVQQLRAMPVIAPAFTPSHPPVPDQVRSQGDLYAAQFTTQLLTQNYCDGCREQLLAWVAAESAVSHEPLLVGLTPPELRSRMALWSVQTGDTPPVPTAAEWAVRGAQGGFTRVRILRVSTPLTWQAAVDNGEITDPSTTARDVAAEVTLYRTVNGHSVVSRYSVALSITLVGPPFRFAADVTSTIIREGS